MPPARVFLCIVVILRFLCPLSASSKERINQNNDQQLWFEEIFQRDLNDIWSYRIRALQYVGADYRRLFNHQYEAMLFSELTHYFPVPEGFHLKNVKIGPGYNATESIQSNTSGVRQWVWFNRLLLENTNTCVIHDWSFAQRNRVEYHIYMQDHYENHGVYRCRIQVTPKTPWSFKPYISNEWFFRKDTWDDDNGVGMVGGWYQNRLRMGCNFEHIGLYWQWRALKQPSDSPHSWFNTYQIGLQFFL